MLEVEADVLALVVVDVDGYFFDQVEGLAVAGLVAFEVGPDDVFGFFGGETLLELAVVVGVDLPADFLGLVGGFADFDSHAVDGPIVWAPDGSDDYCKRFLFRALGSSKAVLRTEGWQEKQSNSDRVERQLGDRPAGAAIRSSHRLRIPLPLRLLLRNLLQPLSTRADLP